MRNLLLFLIIFYFAGYPQGWIRQDNGITQDINSIHFSNALEGYIAGTAGAVYRTSDGGTTWTYKSTGQSETLNGIATNSLGVWAVGNNALLLFSSDNGATWTRKNLSTINRLNSISFSGTTGIIAGDGGTILRTTDNGQTWNLINLPVTVLRSVSLLDTNAVVVGGYVSPNETMFIAKSTDAGLTWQVMVNGNGPTLTGVQVVSPNVIYVSGIHGVALKSTDRGVNWYSLQVSTSQWLYGLSFLDENTGYICGGNTNSGIVLQTTDGGGSFTQDIPAGSRWLNSIYMHKETEGYCVGSSGGKLYKKAGETSWTPLNPRTFSTINDISFLDNNSGVVVGDTGVVMLTTDGGESWSQSPVASYYDINSVDRVATILVAVGDSGLAIRSVDNGATWTNITTPINAGLLAVDMVTENIGYAGGVNGNMLKTTNGGLSWQSVTSPVNMTIRGISFVSEMVGYATGGDFVGGPEGVGFISVTTNGGLSWQNVLSGLPVMTGITTTSSSKIHAIGIKGFAITTSNAGVTWNYLGILTLHWLYAIDFTDELNGYIVGGNVNTGMAWMTNNGGASWFEFTLPQAQWLYAVDMVGSRVYTGGYAGKMLRAEIGVVPVELTSFTASVIGKDQIELNWITQTETNNLGFDIQRDRGEGWENLGFIQGSGTSTNPRNYQFVDRNIQSGSVTTLKYRLIQRDYDGQFNYSDVIQIDLPGTESFALQQNYPNPFNPETSIGFSLPQSSQVTIKVFDILGKQIAVIADQIYNPGYHTVRFNASNLPSGIYFYEMRAGQFREIKRMNLLK